MDASISTARKGIAPHRPDRSRRGQTLVIVLSFLMLMTVLVLVFFGSVMTDSASSRASSGGVAARQLAQSAVQIVEGIITQATVPGPDTNTAWACQPGMIRTYGTSAGSGSVTASSNPLNFYKLYSASQMVLTPNTSPSSTSFTPDSDIVSNWDTSPAFYTDLNAPSSVLDPTQSSGYNLVFPIVDPRAQEAANLVQGFSYSGTTPAGTSVDGVVTTTGSELLPMPVQWLYVLRDGTLVSPTGTGTTATFTGVTSTNPIVGRVAFWTDDECAKVNLNTASEGTYWDTPVCPSGLTTDQFSYPLTAMGDVQFAVNQPGQHEFQRYPGHPATTSLSEVFGASLSGLSRANMVTILTTASPRSTDLDAPDTTGGSQLDTSLGGTQEPGGVTPLKFDRLYASVDDYNFAAIPGGTSGRTQQTLGNGSTTQQIIERSRFFLTTASKAPELNPFNLPKVSIWPVWDDATAARRSTLDNAIVQSSTLSPGAASGAQHEMMFVRHDWSSPTTDYTGFLRNQQLYQYLQSLTNRAMPGFGGNFSASSKWGTTNPLGTTDRDQILTEIFDYIRCTNLNDLTGPTTAPNAQGSPYTTSPSASGGPNTGEVVPIQIGKTRGFGRVPIIAELGIWLRKMDDRNSTSQTTETPRAQSITVTGGPDFTGNPFPTTCTPASETLMEWAIVPRILSVAAGYPALGNDICIHYNSIQLTIDTVSLTYTNSGTSPSNIPDEYDTGRVPNNDRDSDVGGNIGTYALVMTGSPGSPAKSMVPTGLVKVSKTSGTQMALSGTIKLQIFAPNTNTATPMQTITFSIPSGTMVPVPGWGGGGSLRAGVTYTASNPSGTPGPGTLNYPASSLLQAQTKSGSLADPNNNGSTDTTRSLVPTGTMSDGTTVQGDMRVLALTASVAQSCFQFSNFVSGSSNPRSAAPPTNTMYQVSSIRAGNGISGWNGGFWAGLLFSTADGTNDNGSSNVCPGPEVPVLSDGSNLIPPHIGGTNSKIPADWDSAPGMVNDGPFINKPDEGATLATTTGPSQPNLPYLGNYETLTSQETATATVFSPNRIVASAVSFGSLSIGADHPWQTLLFRPAYLPGYEERQSGKPGYLHPGGSDPTIPDHLLLDFFRMPIVEPFTESDALSAMGKVNLNTQIMPFTYIQRTTGLRAVMKSVMITAVPDSFNYSHKYDYYYGSGHSLALNTAYTTRYPIDLDNTIALMNVSPAATDANPSPGYNAYPEFNRATYTATAPNFFISPSQICDLPLIPSIIPTSGSPSYNSMNGIVTSPITALTGANSLETFWANNSYTGDNALERPYSMIYPRVTTQSNTFTVHVRAQSLKQTPNDVASGKWIEGTDAITGEYRGSFTIEKYIDPSHAVIATADGAVKVDTDDTNPAAGAAVRGDDNLGGTSTGTLQHGVLWRLLENRRFGQ